MRYILNAVSLNMLHEGGFHGALQIDEVSLEEARTWIQAGARSGVGHADVADLYSNLLGVGIPPYRATLKLLPGDVALVGQYSGPRLPEGALTLPEGAVIRWFVVQLHSGQV